MFIVNRMFFNADIDLISHEKTINELCLPRKMTTAVWSSCRQD